MSTRHFRPHTVVAQVRGVADDGDDLQAVDLQPVSIPFSAFRQWAAQGMADLLAAAEAEVSGEGAAPAEDAEVVEPAPNRAQRRTKREG